MEFAHMKGMILSAVDVHDAEIIFRTFDTNRTFRLFHRQDCCEDVYVESVVGDVVDLLLSPILLAEEVVTGESGTDESATFTFYKLATVKGYVDIRWVGRSNGYYSERVDFEEVTNA